MKQLFDVAGIKKTGYGITYPFAEPVILDGVEGDSVKSGKYDSKFIVLTPQQIKIMDSFHKDISNMCDQLEIFGEIKHPGKFISYKGPEVIPKTFDVMITGIFVQGSSGKAFIQYIVDGYKPPKKRSFK